MPPLRAQFYVNSSAVNPKDPKPNEIYKEAHSEFVVLLAASHSENLFEVTLSQCKQTYPAALAHHEDFNYLDSSIPNKNLLDPSQMVQEARQNVTRLHKEKYLGTKKARAVPYPDMSAFYSNAEWFRGEHSS